jgi:hypothetical protein
VRRFRDQQLGVIRPSREMEVVGFRIARGEFREELEEAGTALVPEGIPWAEGMLPRAAGELPHL